MSKSKWKLVAITALTGILAVAPIQATPILEGISIEQTTLVPLRTLSEALDVEVTYEPSTQQIGVQTEGITTVMYPGMRAATINGEQVGMSIPPQVIDGTTYVPLRFVGDALGATVDYKNGVVTIGFNGKDQSFQLSTVPKQMVQEVKAFEKHSKTIAGRSVQYVTIDMNDPSIKVDIQTAGDKVNTVNTLAQLAQYDDANVSVNGTYFSAYNGDTPYPSGLIIKDGKPEYLSDIGVVIGFTSDNQVIIDRVTVRAEGYVNEQPTWSSYRVNLTTPDSTATIIYTPMYGGEIPLRDRASTIVCVDNKIVSIGKQTQIPANGFILETFDTSGYAVGDDIRYELTYSPYNTDESRWEDVQYALSAGPSLRIEGERTGDPSKESFSDPKILTQSGSRSFIGVNAKNQVVIGVTSGTIDQMKDVAEEMNLVSAMCLDGGASSGLYYEGQYIRQPGRSINNSINFWQ